VVSMVVEVEVDCSVCGGGGGGAKQGVMNGEVGIRPLGLRTCCGQSGRSWVNYTRK
jgi:hypothetical protein